MLDRQLTRRQVEILEMAIEGHTDVSIARHFGVNPLCVCESWRRIHNKLGAKTHVQAVAIYLGRIQPAAWHQTPLTELVANVPYRVPYVSR
jgi:DNA-binding CsgD family transcriptional regulator